jgi:hypothetical protein
LYQTGTPANILIPIPDDLKGGNETNKDLPRRISPQPMTSSRRNYLRTGSTNSDDSSAVKNVPIVGTTRTTSLKRRTPPPLNMEDEDVHDTSKFNYTTITRNSSSAMTANTNVQFLRQRRSLPLISPPGGYASQNTIKFFHSVPDNGPSLPMLVEAACQVAIRSSTGTRNVNDDTDA